jgi:hypothetical protein
MRSGRLRVIAGRMRRWIPLSAAIASFAVKTRTTILARSLKSI